MKVTKQIPTKEYPYLAVWVGKDEFLDPKLIHNVKVEDIVLISMVEVELDTDKQCYVQYVLGGKVAYATKNEDEYCPLPKGYSLNLCQ
jgi:hypothetical protein